MFNDWTIINIGINEESGHQCIIFKKMVFNRMGIFAEGLSVFGLKSLS